MPKITADIRSIGYYGIVVDESSDISRTEQVSLFFRYIYNGETKETFTGFYSTSATEGQVLYELVYIAVPPDEFLFKSNSNFSI